MRHVLSVAAIFFSFSFMSGNASAHIDINFPAMRDGNQKTGPCESVAFGTGPTTVARPGSEITIRIDEPIAHPGHLRVMFDADASDGDDFPDPSDCDDIRDVNGTTVLGDNLLPAPGRHCAEVNTPAERTPGGSYEITVTLPNIECEACVMQVIQVMTDKGTDGQWDPAGGNGLYFRCSDMKLSLTEDITQDPDGVGSVPPTDAGVGGGGGDAGVGAKDAGTTTPPTNPDGGAPVNGGCNASSPSGLPLSAVFLGLLVAYGFRARKMKVSPKRTSS
jgi:uncharacterized protein (TIGR03382 family)